MHGMNSRRPWLSPAVILATMILPTGSRAQTDPGHYERELKPVLKARCYPCHGALKQQAGLRLDTAALLRKGGDSGAAVIPGEPQTSLLLHRVTATMAEHRMPPEGEPLTAAQIELIRAWIADGAVSPNGEQPESDPREHWAFQVARQLPLPLPAADRPNAPFGRGDNAIDAYLDARLQSQGITPRPAASRSALLRRLYIDLIGMPPPQEELLSLEADDAPDACDRVVDRLLHDPRHGERWGRHWMDIWRYSDWYGRRDVNDVRNSASQIFRWRDWIVKSLNAGKGYDRMIQEMIAADELFPEDYEAGVATGYLIRNYYSLNANDWMRSVVEHTGKAFLGLTFNCAHCHDHKYDPVVNDDYFRMRAFFEPVYIRQDRIPGEADPGIFQDYTYSGSRGVQRLGAVRVFDRQSDAPTWFYTGGDERNRVTDRGSIPPGVPSFLSAERLRIEPQPLPPRAWYPGLRPEIQAAMLADAQAALARAESARAAMEASAAGDQANVVPQEVIDRLAQAESEYRAAEQHAQLAGRSTAISGKQSLLLDATTGRRIVQNRLRELKAVESGSQLSFKLRIIRDAHLNFQFVKDQVQGLTAGYLAFDAGRILAYVSGKPGETEIGRYDFAGGQRDLEVDLLLLPAEDRAVATIRAANPASLLVDQASLTLNGWNPTIDPKQTVSFDARTGSLAAIDDLVWSGPRESASATAVERPRLLAFDFEPPRYREGADLVGIDGWETSSFSVAPATSVIATMLDSQELREAAAKLLAARRVVELPMMRRRLADADWIAARTEQESLEARIAAENSRYLGSEDPDRAQKMRTASAAERQARLAKAERDLQAAEVAVTDAESKSGDDAARAKNLEAAIKNRNAARESLEKLRQSPEAGADATDYTPLSTQFPRTSTGRRRALAEWMTRADHPLTARVAVNHIWTRHFHAPLVASMYDFGRNGARPSHPELLDWLAVDFAHHDWDMKRLHRLIVGSRAYRRDSKSQPATLPGDAGQSAVRSASDSSRSDPENRLLWQMNAARMEAEVLRDSLLYVAGRLDLRQGGVELENKESLTSFRRSLYYSSHPESGGKGPLGELFDGPDPLDCYRRVSSVVPQQALVLTNSEWVAQLAAELVRSWREQNPTDARQSAEPLADRIDDLFIVAMFQRILTRGPTQEELRICRDAMTRQRQLASDAQDMDPIARARESIVRILMNHNDFLTVR